jgi:hypothetical protein
VDSPKDREIITLENGKRVIIVGNAAMSEALIVPPKAK